MRKEEIEQIVTGHFKKITKHFHKAVDKFGMEDIAKFRDEVKKLKVFLHLLNMESEDGFSYRITKRMKTIYGYLGIIQNLHQLKEINVPSANSLEKLPPFYLEKIKNELGYWKTLSKEFISPDYDFFEDKLLLFKVLPQKLREKSIRKFVQYTLYELHSLSHHLNDESLDNIRKLIEDIYYNFSYVKAYLNQQTNLFDENVFSHCLHLSKDYRDKCISLALLQSFSRKDLSEAEQQLITGIENKLLQQKKDLKGLISVQISFLIDKTRHLMESDLTAVNQ